jgi:hypothetical protein
MGMDFKTEAVPLGMLLNVVNSSSAAITYTRSRLIVWRVAVPFALAMIAFAPLGVWLNVQLPVKPLLVFFALFTMSAALLMLSGWKPKHGELSPKGRVVLGLTAGSGLGTIAGLIGRDGGPAPMGRVDWNGRRRAAGRPTRFATDGPPDEVPSCEASLWLGAAGRGRANHRQRCDPRLTPTRAS